MKYLVIFVVFFLFFECYNNNQEQNTNQTINAFSDQIKDSIRLILLFNNITAPVFLTHAKDERFFILEQRGVIRIAREGKILEEPFLDISNKVESDKGYSEKGLLGLAFHPDYKNNGRFFVYYSTSLKERGYDHKSSLQNITCLLKIPIKL